ncbi:hypothetical protein AMS68_003106 [Peltaster fructicola]|uniref:Rhodopsin n=1 Tax=Peltaster fructicola TaxID=286661 RepID=A0A6H0XSJ3_9PEZI|nr:hypothetical protein AMS68_003106 [Peltaster fructicola]
MIVDPVQALAGVATASIPAYPAPTILPPEVEIQAVTETGERTLWVVFVVMLVSGLVFSGLAWSVPASKRLYHILTAFIVFFAAISYFGMATGHAVNYHHIVIPSNDRHNEIRDKHIDRQVYYGRYIDWSITTPLLLIDLALVAGLNGANILVLIVADLVMILTGLFAAYGNEGTPQKWGWYTIACIAFLVVIFQLAYNGRQAALAKGGKVGSFFAAIGGFTLILWLLYPIVWGIADGSRNFSVDQEIIAYAVLDILAKPVFGLWLLITHKNLPETNVELGGFWAHGFSSEGAIRVGDDEEGA